MIPVVVSVVSLCNLSIPNGCIRSRTELYGCAPESICPCSFMYKCPRSRTVDLLEGRVQDTLDRGLKRFRAIPIPHLMYLN